MGSCISSDNIKGNRGCIEVECDPEITKLSQLQNDVGYINESYLDNYYNKTDAENKFQEKGNYALKEDIPSKVSQLENDSEFINKTISNLENYYLKSEIYNKGEINNLLKDGKYLKFKIGGVKPEVGDENTIYLILNGYQGDNIYDEWIYIGNKWELLSSKIDLSQYYTKEYIDSNFQTKGNYIEIETDPTVPAWAKTPNKPEYTSEEVGAIPTGSLSTINGQSLETGENIELQPKTTIDSELSSTSSNPVENKVIKQELDKKQPIGNYVKSAELKAVAITGDYTDLINKPIIPSKVGELENDKNFITEAPKDNKSYSRKDGVWSEITDLTPRVTALEKRTSQVYTNLAAIESSGETDTNKIYIAGDTLLNYTYDGTKFVAAPKGGFNRKLYEAAGAVYNKQTGYYELNGFTDIMEEEIDKIYQLGNKYTGLSVIREPQTFCFYFQAKFANEEYKRTFFPLKINNIDAISGYIGKQYVDLSTTYLRCIKAEKIRIFNSPIYLDLRIKNMNSIFAYSKNLTDILDNKIDVSYCENIKGAFSGCSSLKNVNIFGVKKNINFGDSPLLSRDSLEYMITNAANTSPITITLHADVYAKIVPEAGEWHDLYTLAQTIPTEGGTRTAVINFAQP